MLLLLLLYMRDLYVFETFHDLGGHLLLPSSFSRFHIYECVIHLVLVLLVNHEVDLIIRAVLHPTASFRFMNRASEVADDLHPLLVVGL